MGLFQFPLRLLDLSIPPVDLAKEERSTALLLPALGGLHAFFRQFLSLLVLASHAQDLGDRSGGIDEEVLSGVLSPELFRDGKSLLRILQRRRPQLLRFLAEIGSLFLGLRSLSLGLRLLVGLHGQVYIRLGDAGEHCRFLTLLPQLLVDLPGFLALVQGLLVVLRLSVDLVQEVQALCHANLILEALEDSQRLLCLLDGHLEVLLEGVDAGRVQENHCLAIRILARFDDFQGRIRLFERPGPILLLHERIHHA
mmetsp:Transcript_107835/g.230235  ORF Transcript_107835/g.230235 Transcript_107835/m.230235 type:complete len:254 (-) Transcript_107835:561-1322(-)